MSGDNETAFEIPRIYADEQILKALSKILFRKFAVVQQFKTLNYKNFTD